MNRPARTRAQFLEQARWMRSLPTAVRERVSAEAYDSHHAEGDLVARKGESVHSWIGVADGFLKISAVVRSGRVVMFGGVPTDAWVGEGSVIKREPRHYEIVAMRRSHVVHIPRSTFRWLLDSSFEFNHFIIDHLNERLAQFMAMTETSRMTDPVARVARGISSLFNPILYPGVGPFLRVSQAELGELSGLSRSSTNLALKELERQGLVRAEYKGILVMDLAALGNYQER